MLVMMSSAQTALVWWTWMVGVSIEEGNRLGQRSMLKLGMSKSFFDNQSRSIHAFSQSGRRAYCQAASGGMRKALLAIKLVSTIPSSPLYGRRIKKYVPLDLDALVGDAGP